VLSRSLLQLEELAHDFIFAVLREAERNHLSIDLGVVSKIVEARVTGSRACRAFGIDLVEVANDRLDRPGE
jgi:hypothetical protein